jgi:hypothetical protein
VLLKACPAIILNGCMPPSRPLWAALVQNGHHGRWRRQHEANSCLRSSSSTNQIKKSQKRPHLSAVTSSSYIFPLHTPSQQCQDTVNPNGSVGKTTTRQKRQKMPTQGVTSPLLRHSEYCSLLYRYPYLREIMLFAVSMLDTFYDRRFDSLTLFSCPLELRPAAAARGEPRSWH